MVSSEWEKNIQQSRMNNQWVFENDLQPLAFFLLPFTIYYLLLNIPH